jgi:hypothetical protein
MTKDRRNEQTRISLMRAFIKMSEDEGPGPRVLPLRHRGTEMGVGSIATKIAKRHKETGPGSSNRSGRSMIPVRLSPYPIVNGESESFTAAPLK